MNGNQETMVVAVDDSEVARAATPLKVVHAFQPHYVAGVFGFAKLHPDDEWRADAPHWLATIVKDEMEDFADVECEAHFAGDGRGGTRSGPWGGTDRRRIAGPRRGRLGAARFGELGRAAPGSLAPSS